MAVKLSGTISDITSRPLEDVSEVTVKSAYAQPSAAGITVTQPQRVNVDRTGNFTVTATEGVKGWLYVDGPGWSDSIPFIAAAGMSMIWEAIANALGFSSNMQDYLDVKGGMREILQEAADKIDSVIKWPKGGLEKGTDLNEVTDSGFYQINSYSVAASAKNLPDAPDAINSGTLEVFNLRGKACVQRWTVDGPATGPNLIYIRHSDTAGEWSPWEEIGAKYAWVQGGFEKGTDLNEVTTSGFYKVNTYAMAASMKNLPNDSLAINNGVLEVFNLSGKACVQRWTVNGPATGPNLTYIRHSDTAGEWSPWEKPWENATWEKTPIPKMSNMDDYLTSGMYQVVNYSTATSLVNKPTLPAAINPAVVEVLALDTGQVVQRWTTVGAVDRDNPVMQRTRDNGRNWSEWARIGSGALDAGGGSPLAQVNATRSHQMADRGLLRLLLRGEEGTPVWGWTAPPGEKLEIPTHEGSGQAVHPSVLFFEDGWNGWRYWMVMTPYPNFNEAHEDPNIVVSNNGVDWQVPDGLTNPIDDAKGRPDPYNSDAHLTMRDNEMVLTWRMVDRPNKGRESFWMTMSRDGVHWSPKQKIWWPELSDRHSSTVAQSLLWLGDRWRLYFISTTVSPNQIVWVESTKAVPTPSDWSKPQECSMDFTLPSDRDFWHSEIQYRDGEYWGIVSDANRRTTGVNGVIYLLHSTDGTKWELSPVPLVPQAGDGHDSLYKTGFILSGKGESMTIDVYYSAYDRQTREWGTWRTTARYAGPLGDNRIRSNVDVEWRGDRLVINGEVGPSLAGPKGKDGTDGKDGAIKFESLTQAQKDELKGDVSKNQLDAAIAAEKARTVGMVWMVETEAQAKTKETSCQKGDFIQVAATGNIYKVV